MQAQSAQGQPLSKGLPGHRIFCPKNNCDFYHKRGDEVQRHCRIEHHDEYPNMRRAPSYLRFNYDLVAVVPNDQVLNWVQMRRANAQHATLPQQAPPPMVAQIQPLSAPVFTTTQTQFSPAPSNSAAQTQFPPAPVTSAAQPQPEPKLDLATSVYPPVETAFYSWADYQLIAQGQPYGYLRQEREPYELGRPPTTSMTTATQGASTTTSMRCREAVGGGC